MRILLLITITMIAFAANSVFARVALGDGTIDPATYSLVRLVAGAVMLAVLVILSQKPAPEETDNNWASAFALFAYAAAFSFAYITLDTGTGALILFACVQATMIGWRLLQGDRPSQLEWTGLVVAFAAFVYLVGPGISAPDPLGAALMVISGIAWGVYSLRGAGVADPLRATSDNFIRAVPFAMLLALPFLESMNASPFGLMMAVASGALSSAVGYALWYRTLRHIKSTQAAIVQLTVPPIAALGGILFLDETLTLRLLIATPLILGGVAIAVLGRAKRV